VAEYDNIYLEDRGFMTWIVLNRPQRSNALSHGLLDELSSALKHLRSNGGRVIGIRGEGSGFCAGYDLGDIEEFDHDTRNPAGDSLRLQKYIDHYLELWDHPKPVIAAVHGYCIGGGTQLCSYADITFVTENAKIGESSIPIGGGFVAPLWVPRVGHSRAKELSFVPGARIDGRTAVEWGWANYAVAEGEHISAAEELATKIARMPADALRLKKISINRAAEVGGPRAVTAGVAEIDAIVHASPAIAILRDWLAQVGLKEAARAYQTGEGLPEGI
jgi:enoyl-CoA hydratase